MAQQMTASKFVFRNPGPYQQADLEAVAGLRPGQKLVLADLQAAAQRLADTGCFDDVRVDSTGPASNLTVIFLLKPTPNQQVYPVPFENSPASFSPQPH